MAAIEPLLIWRNDMASSCKTGSYGHASPKQKHRFQLTGFSQPVSVTTCIMFRLTQGTLRYAKGDVHSDLQAVEGVAGCLSHLQL